MGDFLRGTFGCLLQGVLMVLAIVFIILGFVSCANDHAGYGSLFIILSVLCFAAEFGVRYWLGRINRIR